MITRSISTHNLIIIRNYDIIIYMITRIYNDLSKYFHPKEVLIIYGPRRVGKTVLLENFLAKTHLKYKLENGGDLGIQEVFSSHRAETLRQYAEGYELIVIDEAQYIPNIGESLKLLLETVPNIKVIATGSASFDLSNKVGEPLTDRSTILTLYPVAQLELVNQMNTFELSQKKEEYLIYGSYPKVLTMKSFEEKAKNLRKLVSSYLLRDILDLENVKGSKILLDLLRLLAFQIGNEVSLAELAQNLPIDPKTVARYLDLLEKSFVIINIRGYSKNLRKEISNKSKYYFYDNGVRNAVINNFNPLNLRDDTGKLWEN
ncbi:MAG: AAA family ATPase, partial [Candidatus Curtissbacteria bacterium]|nr:AAA family ATPase [Candidatus Curtissbacteria bacterium]